MNKLAAFSVLALGFGLFVFAPVALATIWHILMWLISAGLFFLLVDEYGDLDVGIVAAAIFCLMLTGIGLSLLLGLGWAHSLALALPLITTISLLMTRSEQH